MAIYEYRCPSCSQRFERMRPMTAVAEREACPQCGTASARMLSLFASLVRGSDGASLGPEAALGGGGACGCGGNCGCAS